MASTARSADFYKQVFGSTWSASTRNPRERAGSGVAHTTSWKTTCFVLVTAAVVTLASGCQNRVITDQCFKVPPQLLYPQPGATGIADPHLQLWFGSPGDPSPIFFRPVISPNGGGQSVRGGAYSSPS